MTKQEQFITEVQTGVIIRSVLDNPEAGPKAMWPALINMDDAFYASERIPESMTAHKAACEFLGFKYKDDEGPSELPSWMSRT